MHLVTTSRFVYFGVALHLVVGEAVCLAQLADATWPKYQRDRRNSGCAPYVGPVAPTVKWWSDKAGYCPGAGLVIGWEEEIYIAWSPEALGTRPTSTRGQYSFNLERFTPCGRWVWDRPTDYFFGNSTPCLSDRSIVYLVLGNWPTTGDAYALDVQGGRIWKTDFEIAPYLGHPTVGTDGTLLVPELDELTAINADGSLRWVSYLGTLLQCPSLAEDGTIYVGSSGSFINGLIALNPDGGFRWTAHVGDDGSAYATTLASDGTIYTFGYDYDSSQPWQLYAFDPDGNLKWLGAHVARKPFMHVSVDQQGTIYYGTWAEGEPGEVWAVNPDGSVKWRIETPAGSFASIVIDGASNLYVLEVDAVLRSYDSDGNFRWSFNVGYAPLFVGPAIGRDGTLYIVAQKPGEAEGVMRIVAIGPGPYPQPAGVKGR